MIQDSKRDMINMGDECLVDSGTTHTILRCKEYFSQLSPAETHISTISGTSNLIEGSGRACILLPEGTKLMINDALYFSKSTRNLLSFRDIRYNGYHLETMSENNIEYLQITSIEYGQKIILERLKALSSGLYCTCMSPVESNMVSNQKLLDKDMFTLWHDRLGHPGNIMMRKIIQSSNGYLLKNLKILLSKEMSFYMLLHILD